MSQEAKARDPLFEDPSNATIDTNNYIVDGQDEDKDEDFDPNEDIEDFEIVQKDYYMSP